MSLHRFAICFSFFFFDNTTFSDENKLWNTVGDWNLVCWEFERDGILLNILQDFFFPPIHHSLKSVRTKIGSVVKSQQASLLLQQAASVLAAGWGRSRKFVPVSFVNRNLLVRCQSRSQGFLTKWLRCERGEKAFFGEGGKAGGGLILFLPVSHRCIPPKKMKPLPYPCKQFLYDFVHQNVLARNKPPCCILSQCFLVNVPNEQWAFLTPPPQPFKQRQRAKT